VIGTGEKGFDREGNKEPELQKLSSPWDIVAINRDTLLIAMAGVHQIWALNLKTVITSLEECFLLTCFIESMF
jgi:hypothetical protein